MKGLCLQESEGEYIFEFEGETPEVGTYYLLENAISGTLAQNSLFHALSMEYWKSGHHSYNADNYGDFRNMIKKSLGQGFEGFVYIDMVEDEKGIHPKMFDVKNKDDIPKEVINDPYMKDMIRGKLKSWANYTMKQRKKTIDNLITEMLQSGVNTKKFEEILSGINYGL